MLFYIIFSSTFSDKTEGHQVQNDSGNSPSSRLSLTPEKQTITNGKQEQNDPEMKYQDGKVRQSTYFCFSKFSKIQSN